MTSVLRAKIDEIEGSIKVETPQSSMTWARGDVPAIDRELLDLAYRRLAKRTEHAPDLERQLWEKGYIHRDDLTALLRGIHTALEGMTKEEGLAFLWERIERSTWHPSRISGWL
jgi:phage tail tape-measure protein